MIELIERMLKQNQWWEGKNVETVEGFEKRHLFDELFKYINKKQILAVVGLRRVGKTVLLHQLIKELLRTADSRQILYFSFDELLAKDPEVIENVITVYENEILRRELKDVYIFLDEINHIKEWQVILKRYYDLDKNIKFIVCGSSSLQIKEAKESLAGRIYEFELKPLSFSEFLKLRNIEIKDLTVQSLTLKRELLKYLMRGGFPEIIQENSFEANRKYVISIVDKIIFSDIPKIYDVGNPEILKEIFNIIARSPGTIVEYKNIANTLKISYQTVSKYIHYLEKAYLIKKLYNFRGSPIATARKSKKIYLSTTTLALSVFDSETDFISMLPQIAENAVVSYLDAKYFWREYFELDVLHNKTPIEIKYRERMDIKNNIHAVKKMGFRKLVVVTKDTEKQEQNEAVNVRYVPLWKFILEEKYKPKKQII